MNIKTLIFFSLTLLASACNKAEEYFPVTASTDGPDSYCMDAPDETACEAKAGCQSAFEDSEGSDSNTFSACVANPSEYPPEDNDGTTTGGTTTGGTTDGGTTTGGTTTGGTTTGGTTTGGTTTGGTTTGGTTTGGTVDEPSIDDTYKANCENLKAKHVLVQRLTSKKESTMTKKVKICHKTGNQMAHTIIVACPAIKPHRVHHDDYIGACEI